MFFMITYGMLNMVVFIEQMLNMVSFRPSLNISKAIPLVGLVCCFFVMFLINAAFGLIAIVLVVALYAFLARRVISDGDSDDVRSGLFFTIAEWAANKSAEMPSAVYRAWKPSLLVPVQSVDELNGSYRFLRALAKPQGRVSSLGVYPPDGKGELDNLDLFTRAFLAEKINARTILMEDESFVNGVRATTQVLRHTFFRPNLLFLHLRPDSDLDELQQLVDKTTAYRMGIVLLARHPVNDLGREQIINVWISPPTNWELSIEAEGNDLAILLALQLRQNWNGRINLCMAVKDEEAKECALTLLTELDTLARLPANTSPIVVVDTFESALTTAPRADLTVIGLPKDPNLRFYLRIVDLVNGSCVFVRDSGDESALA